MNAAPLPLPPVDLVQRQYIQDAEEDARHWGDSLDLLSLVHGVNERAINFFQAAATRSELQ